MIHLAEFGPLRRVRLLREITLTVGLLLRKVANELGEADPPRRVRSTLPSSFATAGMLFRKVANEFGEVDPFRRVRLLRKIASTVGMLL